MTSDVCIESWVPIAFMSQERSGEKLKFDNFLKPPTKLCFRIFSQEGTFASASSLPVCVNEQLSCFQNQPSFFKIQTNVAVIFQNCKQTAPFD